MGKEPAVVDPLLNGTDPKKFKLSPDGLRPNPEAKANWFSRITFMFMIPFFYRGFSRPLEVNDMYQPLNEHDSKTATARMSKAWENEKKHATAKRRPASLLRAIIREYWPQIAKWGILLLVEEAVKLSQPVFMGRLIRYFSYESTLSLEEAYIAAAGVSISAALTAMIHHPYFYGLQKTGMQLKVGASGLIVEKGVRLSSAALQKATVGHMVNILSTDISKFDMGFIFVHYIWIAPLILISYGTLLWQEIGVSTLAGFFAIILLIPFQGYCSRQMGSCRREIAVRADKRISVMNEILNGIRVIKMYAWEGAFSKVIGTLRNFEVEIVRKNAIFQSLVMGLFWASGKLIILFAAACFVALGNDLTAERIFVANALYNACRLPVTLFLPFSIQFICEMRVSIRRIQDFIELEDFQRVQLPSSQNKRPKEKKENGTVEEETPLNETDFTKNSEASQAVVNVKSLPDSQNSHIEMDAFCTSWSTADDEGDEITAIKNATFSAKKGDLVAVVGPVGAGKSSLLYSLLGEARATAGKLSMSGTVAYCAQDSWIFSGTVQENVLFGQPFNDVKYKNALEVSALLNDVSQFPQGDQTMVGDRGTSLSGGQKARVALARAIYADADIYLLDDPLSAVDAAVGRFLFDKCICGHLKSKVVILVTHQVQFLDKADTVLLMKGGEVVAAGTPGEMKTTYAEEFASLIQETQKTYSRLNSESSPRSRTTSQESEVDDLEIISIDRQTSALSARSAAHSEFDEPQGKAEHVQAVQEEERNDGAVEWRIYWVYIRTMCGHWYSVIPLMIFVIFVQLISNVGDWWLNKWADASERSKGMEKNGLNYTGDIYPFLGTVDLVDYELIFAGLTVFLLFVAVIRCVWFRLRQTTASVLLHEKMFTAIVNTNIYFFDTNPIGRILNRFSKDVGTMDDQLSFVFFEFLMGALNIFFLVCVIVILNPLVILPTLPLVVFFVFLRVVYLRSSRDVKRLEATSRSPLYSHISATMQGLMTVRAFSRQNQIIDHYHHVQNVNSAAFSLSLTTSRWFAVSIDWVVAFFVSFVAFFSVIEGSGERSSGEVALMLVYAVQLTGFFSWIMRQSAELQNGMVSVERIVNYSELPSEHLEGTNANVGENWPSAGHIKMSNLYLKYDEDSDFVLKNVNLDIKPKEKIGIVGRTGAGKSSLLRALFRLTVPSTGSVFIDDVNTASVPLERLRKSIAIIPQEPVLFIGSLRHNLDPFNDYSDDAIWDVLEQVELKQAVSEMNGGLEASMQEGGANFSVGQRQLVCLARALLRHAKVLVIDEATANVDQMTDTLIQNTLRKRFADSTVLTIAHRLNTIMDSTRVLVLKDGEVAEFAPAHLLLQNKSSILSSLVEETGKANTDLLRKMAKEAYEKN